MVLLSKLPALGKRLDAASRTEIWGGAKTCLLDRLKSARLALDQLEPRDRVFGNGMIGSTDPKIAQLSPPAVLPI